MPLITRPELRLALTTGLVNGFASLSGLAFGFYAPLAVLAVCSGTYGASLELGRQRILGSVLGMVLVVVGLRGLQGVPMPLGLGITLGALRLIGGALKLRVGYKVGGMIVVMGWLAHDDQLATWVPLRLFWTVVGILAALLSLRLFWPSSGVAACHAALAGLFTDLAADLDLAASADAPALAAIGDSPGSGAASPMPAAAAGGGPMVPRRQAALQRLRGLLPALLNEVGSRRHPAFQLVDSLERAASQLLGASRDLAAHPPLQPPGGDAALIQLEQAEAALLATLAARLRLWADQLSGRRRLLPPPPPAPLALPEAWLAIEAGFAGADLEHLPPPILENLAIRFTLCRQAREAIAGTERGWAALALGTPAPSAAPRSSRLAPDRPRPAA